MRETLNCCKRTVDFPVCYIDNKGNHMAGVIMLGGGLDSTALLIHLVNEKQNLIGIWFSYGQLADHQERSSVDYFCNKYKVPLKVFNVPLYDIAESAILRGHGLATSNKLEGRNVIFTMLAATYAVTIGAEELYLGYHLEPPGAPFPDATAEAAEVMQLMLNTAYKTRLRLLAPFKHLSRTSILRHGYALDEELITQTHTCYADTPGGCGKCVHCRQRATMINNMLSDLDEPLEENH